MCQDSISPLDSQTMQPDFHMDYVRWFRHIAPYINMHRGKIFVLMFGGEALLDRNFKNIIHDIVLLHALGIRLVLVYGARPQINHNLQLLSLETPFYQHRRITTRESLPAVLNAVGSIRLQIEAMLSMGLANSPMFGAKIDVVSGNFVIAKPFGIRDGIDFQLTGEVRSIDCQAIQANLAQEHIVLLGSTGYSTTGEVFNLRAEDVAMAVACELRAEKLIYLGEQQGIFDQHQQLIREFVPETARLYLQQHAYPSRSDYLQVAAALYACQHGVNRCHILSYAEDGALLGELFTRDGLGTLITNTPYEDIRQATIQDVGGLLSLLRPLEQQGILVYRSRERLESEIDYFAVIERDGTILACAALYPIPTTGEEEKSAEIACVAVHPDYRKSNRGAKVLEFLQQQARQQQIKKIFLLTTHTGHWFMEQGFYPVAIEDLPQARQALYNYQRNSQAYCKDL